MKPLFYMLWSVAVAVYNENWIIIYVWGTKRYFWWRRNKICMLVPDIHQAEICSNIIKFYVKDIQCKKVNNRQGLFTMTGIRRDDRRSITALWASDVPSYECNNYYWAMSFSAATVDLEFWKFLCKETFVWKIFV